MMTDQMMSSELIVVHFQSNQQCSREVTGLLFLLVEYGGRFSARANDTAHLNPNPSSEQMN